MANLGPELGQACVQNWPGAINMMDPQAQLSQASALPVGEGWLQTRSSVRNTFRVVCLKGVYVIHPNDSTRILKLLEPLMSAPIPWSRQTSDGVRTWCGPSYACAAVAAPSPACAGKPWTATYPSSTAPGVCLPQYDYTQRPNGQANSYCWNQSNAGWKAFWVSVADAVRRFNAA